MTPWERANLTGFSIQPFIVLVMASMSRAVITRAVVIEGRMIERRGAGRRGESETEEKRVYREGGERETENNSEDTDTGQKWEMYFVLCSKPKGL